MVQSVTLSEDRSLCSGEPAVEKRGQELYRCRQPLLGCSSPSCALGVSELSTYCFGPYIGADAGVESEKKDILYRIGVAANRYARRLRQTICLTCRRYRLAGYRLARFLPPDKVGQVVRLILMKMAKALRYVYLLILPMIGLLVSIRASGMPAASICK